VDLELHQLTLRYERLRKRHLRKERGLLVSLSEIGQQLPVVVIQEAPSFILIDGYKRPMLKAWAIHGKRIDETTRVLSRLPPMIN
jgi:hypothetical protein